MAIKFSPEKNEILDIPLVIKEKGVFDYEGVYKMMHAWLISKRFIFHESKYKDKVSTPFGNEIEVAWVAGEIILSGKPGGFGQSLYNRWGAHKKPGLAPYPAHFGRRIQWHRRSTAPAY